MRTPSILAPLTLQSATFSAAALFLALLAFFAWQTPLTFDDAFNANVALSLAKGRGYGTHTGGSFVGFNPLITSGAFFISPLALPLLFVKPSITLIQCYSLGVTYLFFGITLYFSWRIQRYIPLILIVFSAAFLMHGKTDIVEHTQAASLPAPPYGLWFQFLGNLPGTWALIAATTICASKAGSPLLRHLLVFCCAAFACNAKMVHALPMAIALGAAFTCAPKRLWSLVLVGCLGILAGVKGDSWLAWVALEPEDFQMHRAAAQSFVTRNLPAYSRFFEAPSIGGFIDIVAQIPKNLGAMSGYVGEGLLIVMIFSLCMVAILLSVARRSPPPRELLVVLIANGAAAAAVIAWWASMPGAPTRFLTSAAPLVAATSAAACAVVLSYGGTWWRALTVTTVGAVVTYSLFQGLDAATASSHTGSVVRAEQQEVARLVRAKSTGHRKQPLCGDAWWYPHEITFLNGAPKTISCALDRARRVVIPKHIFPAQVITERISPLCHTAFSGLYYELALCKPTSAR